MAPYAAYDPAHPLEQLADRMRQELCDIALRELNARASDEASIELFQYMVMGMLTGVAGVAIAHHRINDDAHIMLRVWLRDCLTQAFDQARGCHELPPLPEPH